MEVYKRKLGDDDIGALPAAFNDALAKYDKEIPKARKELENEFRGLLGDSLSQPQLSVPGGSSGVTTK